MSSFSIIISPKTKVKQVQEKQPQGTNQVYKLKIFFNPTQ